MKKGDKIYLNKNCCKFCNSFARSSTRHHEVSVKARSSASKVITSGTSYVEFDLKLNIEACGTRTYNFGIYFRKH